MSTVDWLSCIYLGHLIILEESEEPGVLGPGAGDGGVQDVGDHGAVPQHRQVVNTVRRPAQARETRALTSRRGQEETLSQSDSE